jgi:hypothetical protein
MVTGGMQARGIFISTRRWLGTSAAAPFPSKSGPLWWPLLSHRYLPEEPREPGNPVLSVFYSGVIFYGNNLADYFEREFSERPVVTGPDETKHIPFWSDLVMRKGWITAPPI